MDTCITKKPKENIVCQSDGSMIPIGESNPNVMDKCYNYIIKRLNQLDYRGAIASDLPIGSRRIESSHRFVIQKRLKLPGAWWALDNAQKNA